jgi:hypothetical protein
MILAFHADQPNTAHKDGISAGLRSPANAQTKPAGIKPPRTNNFEDATANTVISRNADKHASQLSTGAFSIGGHRAQKRPAMFPARSLKCARATYITSTTVASEKSSCTTTMIVAAIEPVPNTDIIAARNNG